MRPQTPTATTISGDSVSVITRFSRRFRLTTHTPDTFQDDAG
jgi:hypothetical protein